MDWGMFTKGRGEVLGINRQSLKFCCSPKYPAISSPPFVARTIKRQKCVCGRQKGGGGWLRIRRLFSQSRSVTVLSDLDQTSRLDDDDDTHPFWSEMNFRFQLDSERKFCVFSASTKVFIWQNCNESITSDNSMSHINWQGSNKTFLTEVFALKHLQWSKFHSLIFFSS